jgi:hypothetical protein
MPNSTPLVSTPPEHAAAAEDASGGGTSYDEAAGMLCHYSTNAKRAPPRLELKVDAPLLRLIKFMRSAAAGTQVAVCRAEDEELGEPAKKRMGRRRLGKVAVRLLQLGPHNVHGSSLLHYRNSFFLAWIVLLIITVFPLDRSNR